jgi:thiamine-monophosphate kinase
MMSSVADLGEFGLIARIAAALPGNRDVVLGAGDDAAVLDVGGPDDLVATCDAQIEGIHFTLDRATPEEIGQHALAVNLSDLAAMGAKPRFALVSLLVPPDLPVAVLDGIYAGLAAEAALFDVAIVGGNIARNPERLAIDITALGTGRRGHLLLRSGARPGDAICVTGTIGGAAAGLIVSQDTAIASRLDRATMRAALADLHTPTPRVVAGQWLADHRATAAIDISDGLAADLGHLCAASHLGAEIDADALPIAPHARAVAEATARDPLDLALHGGEDYELIVTLLARDAASTLAALVRETGTAATIIGRCVATPGLMLVRDGRATALAPAGWNHLQAESSQM